MWCMVLVDGLEWEEVGEVLMDGLTDIDLIGDGVVILGVVLALVLGVLTTSVVSPASLWSCALTTINLIA